MDKVIEVMNLCKKYKTLKKEEGLKGSIKSLFSKNFEEKTAVNNINFSINEGEFIGFIGPNGAGKTTTIKMLSGIIHPTSGYVSVLGYVPQELNNEFKKKISVAMGQKNQLWWDIPAQDSFRLIKVIFNIPDKQFKKSIDELTEMLNVKHILNVPLRDLSLGERMKMEIIGSLLHQPKILFLDEPTIGLDVFSRRKIREFLQYINSEMRTTIILTSHYLEDIEILCNRIIAINHGSIIYDGDTRKFKTNSLNQKYVSISAYEDKTLKPLEKYGEFEYVGDKTIKLIIDKDNLQNLGKEVFLNENFLDINIGEVPLEKTFEILFNQEGS